MALLALIIGSFLVSLGVAAVGVVVQDRAEKIASEIAALQKRAAEIGSGVSEGTKAVEEVTGA